MKNRKKGKMLLLIIILLLTYFPFSLVLANGFNDYYPVDAEPNVDGEPNIGDSGTTDHTDVQVKDGSYEEIEEVLQDYTENESRLFHTGGRVNNNNFPANDKGSTRLILTETITIHTFTLYFEVYSADVEIRMGLYNSSGTGQQENPTDLLAETDSQAFAVDAGVWQWVNFTLDTPVTCNAYHYWITFHTNATVRVKTTALLLWNTYSRYRANDAFSDGLEDPYGAHNQRDGGGYRLGIYYNHTVQSYQLDWSINLMMCLPLGTTTKFVFMDMLPLHQKNLLFKSGTGTDKVEAHPCLGKIGV